MVEGLRRSRRYRLGTQRISRPLQLYGERFVDTEPWRYIAVATVSSTTSNWAKYNKT